MANLTDLQSRWKHLYQDHLPALAQSRDPVQKTWPVHLDHCFARIVLDNAIGVNGPWTNNIKQPAVRNMSAEQFELAIDLAERVATGESDLVELNSRSLELRGRKRKAVDVDEHSLESKKQKRSTATISSYFLPSPSSPKPGRNTSDDASPNENALDEDGYKETSRRGRHVYTNQANNRL